MMDSMRKSAWLPCIMPLVIACGSDSSDQAGSPSSVEIASTTMSGVVGGESWALVNAQTDAFLSKDEDDFWADLYAETMPSCTSAATNTKPHIILNVPRAPGDYPLSQALSATFVIEGTDSTPDNLVATRGRLVVEEITSTLIRGGADIQFNSSNHVNGRFEIAVCAE